MIEEAKNLIKNSKYCVAFTGAGISVESGIPTFRGEGGIWLKENPQILDINYFKANPKVVWKKIIKNFYEPVKNALPNPAHFALAKLERAGLLKYIITQNIDNLHFKAGNKNIAEYHGNTRQLICMKCGKIKQVTEINFEKIPPLCDSCGGLLKPDFVFFGEPIPVDAAKISDEQAHKADVMLVIGTSGEIMPASVLPYFAKQAGAKIIEINTEKSKYTDEITDIFLQGKAGEILPQLVMS